MTRQSNVRAATLALLPLLPLLLAQWAAMTR